jgi:hypothetical protein
MWESNPHVVRAIAIGALRTRKKLSYRAKNEFTRIWPSVEKEGGLHVRKKLGCKARNEFTRIWLAHGKEMEGGGGRGVLEWHRVVEWQLI